MPKSLLDAVCAAAILMVGALPGRAQWPGEFERRPEAAAFELSLGQEYGADGTTSLVVSTTISNRQLVFLKKGDRYESRYRVYLELRDRHRKVVRGEVWEEAASTAEFRETTSTAAVSTSRRSFVVPPGEFTAIVTIEVLDTSRKLKREERVRVLGSGEDRLAISPPSFFTPASDSSADRPAAGELFFSRCASPESSGFRINPGAVYGDFGAWPRVVFTVAAPAADRSSAELAVRIVDARGATVLYGRHGLDTLESGTRTVCADFGIDDIRVGSYRCEASVTVSGEERSASEGRFTVLLNRGLLRERYQDLIEILTAYSEGDGMRGIEEAGPGERFAAWKEFWLRRDPTPSTDANEEYGEFLRRLRYVFMNFARYRPGWQTDMGKVYLRNGQPDRIDSEGERGSSLRPTTYYTVWYYYSRGLAYVFEDALGSGDPRLMMTRVI